MPVYLRQHAVEGSALGIFKHQHTILLGSGGRHLYYLSSIGVKKVSVELALYNKTYYFCQMPCLRRNGDYMGAQPAKIL